MPSATGMKGRRKAIASGSATGAFSANRGRPPSSTAITCSVISSATLICASSVEAPRCGVVITCGSDSSGFSPGGSDRKSTRLNSSHANISYAVFCLKKKKLPDSTYIVASREHLKQLFAAPEEDLSLARSIGDRMQVRYTFDESIILNQYHVPIVRTQ